MNELFGRRRARRGAPGLGRVSIPVLVNELFGHGAERRDQHERRDVSIPVLVNELFGPRAAGSGTRDGR